MAVQVVQLYQISTKIIAGIIKIKLPPARHAS